MSFPRVFSVADALEEPPESPLGVPTNPYWPPSGEWSEQGQALEERARAAAAAALDLGVF